jgi:hypothetical protein
MRAVIPSTIDRIWIVPWQALIWELIASRLTSSTYVYSVNGNRMKLTKKQLSASYVTQATVATGRWATDDVANHRDSRLDRCSVASPEGKVESIPQVSFCTTSGDKAMESMAGLENQPRVEITPLQLYVEEGPQSVCSGTPIT